MSTLRQFGEPLEGVKYVERIGAYGIALQGGSVLIELGRLGYFLPGGGVEAGETVVQALCREFIEETGYRLRGWWPLREALEYVHIRERNYHLKKINHFFGVDLGQKGEPTFADGHVRETAWRSVGSACGRMYLPSQRWAIEEVLKSRRRILPQIRR